MNPAWRGPLLGLLLWLGVFGLMFSSGYNDAPAYDEPDHVTAGYTYVQTGEFWLNPFHPPLVKELSGLFLSCFPWEPPQQGWRDHNKMATIDGLFFSGKNDPQRLIRLARIPVMALTAGFAPLFFFYLRRHLGTAVAGLALTLLVFSPTYLAHGRFVTTDVPCAMMCFWAICLYAQQVETPGLKAVFKTGLVTGLALLTKFSAVLLVPFFWLVGFAWRPWRQHLKEAALITGLALAVIGVGYGHIPVSANYQAWYNGVIFPQQKSPVVRLIRATEGSAWLRPWSWYATGLYAQMRQLTTEKRPGYLKKKFYRGGRWDFFPTLILTKEPLGTLLLGALALVLAARAPRPPLLVSLLLLFSLAYLGAAMRAHLNIGIRHAFPAFPGIYAAIAWCLVRGSTRGRWVSALIGFGLLSTVLSSLLAYPGYLAYFNAVAGGKVNGPQIALDSNFDWGTDLYRLKLRLDASTTDHMYVVYFGRSDPRAYLGSRYRAFEGQPLPAGELLAISAHHWVQAQLASQGAAPAPLDWSPETVKWVVSQPEVDRIGDTILLLQVQP